MPTDTELLDWIEKRGGVRLDKESVRGCTYQYWTVGTQDILNELISDGTTLREALTAAMKEDANAVPSM